MFIRIITISLLLYYYCHEWSSHLPTATAFTVTFDSRRRHQIIIIPPTTTVKQSFRIPTTTTTTTTTTQMGLMIHHGAFINARRRRRRRSSLSLRPLPSSSSSSSSSKSSLKVFEDTGYDSSITDESSGGGGGGRTTSRSLLRRSIVLRPLSKIAKLSIKTKSRLLFVIRRLLFSIKLLQFIDATTTTTTTTTTTATAASTSSGSGTTTTITENDTIASSSSSSSSSSSPLSLSSPSSVTTTTTPSTPNTNSPSLITTTHHHRWAISSPTTNLSGTWHLIVTPHFKTQYDQYLQSLNQPPFVRNVALAIASSNTEIITQSSNGKVLHLKGLTPKGCWIRELRSSGWTPEEEENDDFDRVSTLVKTADGEYVEAESWWECHGTVHKSWLRGGKKYGGGDFESTRYLEKDDENDDGEDVVLVCETVFHPRSSRGEEGVKKKKGEIRWRFRRG